MKRILRNLLIGSSEFHEYPAVSMNGNSITETVALEIDGRKSDVSHNHWLLSLEPMVFGIWLADEFPVIQKQKKGCLYFNSQKNKMVAKVHLILANGIEGKEGTLFLFEVKKATVFHFSQLKIRLIYEAFYRKPNHSFTQFQNLASAFSYPRKVRVISFKEDNYFNIFPMDLVGDMGNGRLVFGLRHTNITLNKIIRAKKLVVAEVPFFAKDGIYTLSHHHSSRPPDEKALPFKVITSELFRFPVPEWAIGYQEIEIEKTIDLGSHCLLWGKSITKVELDKKGDNLFHIHFLNYLGHDNQYVIDS